MFALFQRFGEAEVRCCTAGLLTVSLHILSTLPLGSLDRGQLGDAPACTGCWALGLRSGLVSQSVRLVQNPTAFLGGP